MKRLRFYRTFLFVITLVVGLASGMALAENIDPDNDNSQFAWGENVGWINFEPLGDGGSGAEVGNSTLTGYAWGENIGWISLSCTNTSSCGTVDYGVSNDGAGNLSGYAWGENVGWISLSCETTASCGTVDYGVTIDPATGEFSGYAWGENIGWINLAPAGGGVITSWPDAGVDSDGDGFNDLEEAIGGTDPEDDLSVPISETTLVDGNPTQPVRLVAPQGVVIINFQWVDPDTISTPPPGTFPQGLVSINLRVPNPGDTTTVAVTFPTLVNPASIYYKFGPTAGDQTDHWYSFPFGSNDGDATITLTLTDGGAGDHDLVADESIIDPGGPGIPAAPTLIRLTSFTATASDGEVLIEWTTGAEIDNEGFNILRSEAEEGPYSKLNDTLIPARAISPGGASYSFMDTTVESGETYFYKLEDIDTRGVSTLHGPIEITVVEGEESSFDLSSESQSGFGCGFIRPTGKIKPPDAGQVAVTLLMLFSPLLIILSRRLIRMRRLLTNGHLPIGGGSGEGATQPDEGQKINAINPLNQL